jgi:hypothetical protein
MSAFFLSERTVAAMTLKPEVPPWEAIHRRPSPKRQALIRGEIAGRAIGLVLTPVIGIRIIPADGDSLTEVPDSSSPNLFGFQMSLPSSLIGPTERIAR